MMLMLVTVAVVVVLVAERMVDVVLVMVEVVIMVAVMVVVRMEVVMKMTVVMAIFEISTLFHNYPHYSQLQGRHATLVCGSLTTLTLFFQIELAAEEHT